MKTIGQKVLELVFRLAPADSQEAFLRPKLHGHYNLKYLNCSYSQEGEDMVLARYLEGQKNGFYVDVGAHHPFRFSNTYHFYLKGWHGVNIDPLWGMMNFDPGMRIWRLVFPVRPVNWFTMHSMSLRSILLMKNVREKYTRRQSIISYRKRLLKLSD